MHTDRRSCTSMSPNLGPGRNRATALSKMGLINIDEPLQRAQVATINHFYIAEHSLY